MAISFAICEALAEKYRSLRFDAACSSEWNLVPLGALSWPDEHPDGTPVALCHEECRDTILRLCAARINFWHSGVFSEELQSLRDEARRVFPSWPGFHRLHLTTDQLKSLADCENHVLEMFTEMFGNVDEVRLEDKGGGITGWSAIKKLDDS